MTNYVAEDIDDDDPYYTAAFAAARRGERLSRDEALRLLDERRKRKTAQVFPGWSPPPQQKI